MLVDGEGTLVVPELRNALPGTTLLRAMRLAGEIMPVMSRPVLEDELYDCREIILLGTSIDAVGVVRYNGRVIGNGRPGPVSAELRRMLVADRKAHGQPLRG